MRYNKVIAAGLLAIAVGIGAGCSTKTQKDDVTMVPVEPYQPVECLNLPGNRQNNADGTHHDGMITTLSDCSHYGGRPVRHYK